jgi:hypothetical protein
MASQAGYQDVSDDTPHVADIDYASWAGGHAESKSNRDRYVLQTHLAPYKHTVAPLGSRARKVASLSPATPIRQHLK